MKANELMLGDWVFVDEYDEYTPAPYNKPYPIQILSGADIDRADEISFEPIPLTPEIMEKNGFWVMEKVDNGAEEYIAYATDGLILHYNRDNDYYFPDTPISWKYVHELQHALHLCGLNELADNFKI